MNQFDTIDDLEAKASEASATLRLLANEKRLLVLCRLIKEGEMTVSALAAAAGLGQSALSQHLARLRADGIVAVRREAQQVHYRIADEKVRRLLDALYAIYCASPENGD
ncbi:ArsR/SmtB family transcription factor [Minwuia thermotolerans]|uniref:Transcriptional regulator n=1 Tax=Minwuia thermotolerans TaxID=2056226 RepID=A0A2M9FVH0_9PROT|nr:metalloregulator ArsR/SmtB family transcription factor [Minwuia thermotolerans]PJK27465.1 transcriptional regulator [Minwuia thermotolerans]